MGGRFVAPFVPCGTHLLEGKKPGRATHLGLGAAEQPVHSRGVHRCVCGAALGGGGGCHESEQNRRPVSFCFWFCVFVCVTGCNGAAVRRRLCVLVNK